MPTIRVGLLTLPLAGLLLTWAAIATSAFFDFTGARLRPYGLPLGVPQGTLDTTRDGLEHFGHRHVALLLRPEHLRASGPRRGVPGRCEKRCSVGNHHLRRADPERLLRGLLTLLGGLHPLRLWCLEFRSAAQVGWGALGSPCPPSYRAHT